MTTFYPQELFIDHPESTFEGKWLRYKETYISTLLKDAPSKKKRFVDIINLLLNTVNQLHNYNNIDMSNIKRLKTSLAREIFVHICNNPNLITFIDIKFSYTIYNKAVELGGYITNSGIPEIEYKEFIDLMKKSKKLVISCIIDYLNLKIKYLQEHINSQEFAKEGLHSIMKDIDQYLPNEVLTDNTIIKFKEFTNIAKEIGFSTEKYKNTKLVKCDTIIENKEKITKQITEYINKFSVSEMEDICNTIKNKFKCT